MDVDEADQNSIDSTVFLNIPGKSGRTVKPGDVLGDNYRLKDLIGQGGMGVVYRCRHLIMEEDYAIKLLRPDKVTDITWQRFQVEARAIARLEHANIVRIFNMGIDGQDCPYYVMELLQGDSLRTYLEEHVTIDVDSALAIFYQLAAGLGYAHSKGIVHRDIKPSNIVLQKTEGSTDNVKTNVKTNFKYIVKIVDFGLAKLVDRNTLAGQSLTSAGEVFGSPFYMSPEQSLGKEVDARSDIYSLGCTLFKTLTGSPPFRGENPFQTILMHQNQPAPTLSSIVKGKAFAQDLEHFVHQMLAKKPDDRQQSMEQICADIRRLQGDKGAHKTGAFGVVSSHITSDAAIARKHSALVSHWPAILLAAFFIASLAGTGIVYFARQGEQSSGITGDTGAKSSKDTTGSTVGTAIKTATSVNNSSDRPTIETAKSDPEMSRAKAVFAAFKHRETKLINGKNGVLVESYFPDLTVGVLENGARQRAQARGLVRMPLRRPITLEIRASDHRNTWAYPWILKQIDTEQFDDLILSQQERSEGAADTSDKSILDMLTIARNWKHLQGLSFRGCTLNAKALDAVERFPNLGRFTIKNSDNKGSDLVPHAFWARLYEINLANLSEVDPVLAALSGSKILRRINLDGTTPSPAAIAKLSRCPNLETLSLERTGLSAEQVAALSHLSQLKELWLKHVPLDPAQLIKLDGLKHLEYLQLSAEDWSTGQRVSTKMALPNCNMDMGRPNLDDRLE